MKYFEEFGDYNPADHHHELFNEKKVPHDQLLQLTSAQDYSSRLWGRVLSWIGTKSN